MLSFSELFSPEKSHPDYLEGIPSEDLSLSSSKASSRRERDQSPIETSPRTPPKYKTSSAMYKMHIDIAHALSPTTRELIDKTYFPGLLDDAVNKKIDFNEAIENIFKNRDETGEGDTSLSMIQAFDMKVQAEQESTKKMLQKYSPARAKAQKYLSAAAGKTGESSVRKQPRRPVREENMRLTTTALDVVEQIGDRSESEIGQAIQALTKAQELNNFAKAAEAADQAAEAAPPGFEEQAAYTSEGFKMESLSTSVQTVPGSKIYKPIEIVSYLGITRPER